MEDIISLIIAFIIAMGLPSAFMGFLVWWLKRYIDKKESKKEEHDKNVEKMILLIAQNGRATYTVAKATAIAVQRIPDAHCNGDMTEALGKAEKLQTEEQQFIIDQGMKRIFGDN